MYELYVLGKSDWQFVYESPELEVISRVMEDYVCANHHLAVLQDKIVLCFLDGSQFQYEWFKNKYLNRPKILNINSKEEPKSKKKKKKRK